MGKRVQIQYQQLIRHHIFWHYYSWERNFISKWIFFRWSDNWGVKKVNLYEELEKIDILNYQCGENGSNLSGGQNKK